MSSRTALVGASLGAVVLLTAAARVTVDSATYESAYEKASMATSVFETLASDAPKAAMDTAGTHYKLLAAVYGRPNAAAGSEATSALSEADEQTLWLARAIYSETKLPHEQELVAWVVRNRVETGYRGQTSYRDVVLDPYQFSAFNPNSAKRAFYATLTPEMQLPGWHQAINIAHYVRHADAAYRPFSIKTRHFFSERSMKDRRFPFWVEHHNLTAPSNTFTVEAERFRFYKKIS